MSATWSAYRKLYARSVNNINTINDKNKRNNINNKAVAIEARDVSKMQRFPNVSR